MDSPLTLEWSSDKYEYHLTAILVKCGRYLPWLMDRYSEDHIAVMLDIP